MQITKVELGSTDFKSFLEVPSALDPDVSPMQLELETAELSPNNVFFGHAEGCGFVCEKDGALMGRVFASFDQNLRQEDGQVVGHIGYFECSDDSACAQALLTEAEAWLKAKSATCVHGPMNLNIFTAYRLQMTGFGTEPFPAEPRNPEYYVNLFEKSGYEVLTTWGTWDLPNAYVRAATEIYKGMVADSPRDGINIRSGSIAQLEEEFTALYAPGMEMFSENYGFSTISCEEFLGAFMHLQSLMEDRYFHILTDDNGEIGGFILGYRDAPENHSRIVFHTVGFLPKWRKSAAPYILGIALWDAASQTEYPVVGALAKEGKSTYDRQGPPTRTYSIWSKPL